MKAARFEYERPADIERAIQLLASADREAKILAGGQSLGPMLNLRLATPELLVDVTRIPELNRVESEHDTVVLGACVTHAAIEDRRVPDGTHGIMPRVARGIAYRAVRNRGTVGGSLAHADPAADWIVCLAALGAEVVAVGAGGRRSIAVSELVVGAFETSLRSGEMIESVRIPRPSARASWGFYKVTRKEGKFADAMAAVLCDSERGVYRVALGAMESKPVVVADAATLCQHGSELVPRRFGSDTPALRILKDAGLGGDDYAIRVHIVALQRALAQTQPT